MIFDNFNESGAWLELLVILSDKGLVLMLNLNSNGKRNLSIFMIFYNFSESGAWLDAAAGAIVDIFRLGVESDEQPVSTSTPMEVESSEDKKSNKSNRHRKKFNSVWVIPYLVRNLKFLQSRVLKASCTELECGNMFKPAPAMKPGKQVSEKGF